MHQIGNELATSRRVGLDYFKRRRVGYLPVERLYARPYIFGGFVYFEIIQRVCKFFRIRFVLKRNWPAQMCCGQLHDAAGKVADAICQVGIVRGFKMLPCDISILKRRYIARKIVAHRIGAVLREQLLRVDDVTERLAHFFAAGGNKPVHQKGFWERQACREQHAGPNGAVEAQYVLAEHMHSGLVVLPKLLIQSIVASVSERGYVVGKRVAPNVHNLQVIARYRDTETFGPVSAARTGEAYVLQPLAQERKDFFLS